MKKAVSENNYVNAFTDRDDIIIIERDKDGKRIIKREPLDYIYYTLDDNGNMTTIFGEKCRQNVATSKKELSQAVAALGVENVYESDVNQVFRYLSANYDFESTPNLNVATYDIEVEFREETRYSNPDDAENRIISIAVSQRWSGRRFAVVLVPDNKTVTEAEAICARVQSKHANSNIILAKTEAELLNIFMIIIEDADVITGWNSESYDFKYIVNRTKRILGEEGVRRLSPIGGLPREREAFNEKTKSYYKIYEPSGLVHLDYLLLYKKYTYIELTSYSLDNVSYVELDDQKVDYDGNLYDLYLNDLETFIDYNIKDVDLVDRLDDKLKFIDLTNLLAHNNGVLMQTTLGTVALTEQAIINEGHYYFDTPVVFPNKPKKEEDTVGAAGAFVVDPKKGVNKSVSGIDVESLYPSIIRMLNMSPETLVGHINSERTDKFILGQVESGNVKSATESWHSLFNTLEFEEVINKTSVPVTFEFNRSDEKITASGAEIYDLIFNNENLCISANGTVFNRSKIGVIPSLLTRWFMERRKLKKLKDEWKDKLDQAQTDEEKKECSYWVSFYDQRQLAKKINLNALYGALLNKSCRFYDKRIGQSTTLSGRTVTKHMGSQVNKIVIGEYTVNGGAVVYGDTDSIYFSVEEALKEKNQPYTLDKDQTIELYNSISKDVNATFPSFLHGRFNVGLERGAYIRAERENLSDYSLFIKKKRYAMRLYDVDGRRMDVGGKKGKMKYMGIEVKRSDTPKIIQDVLVDGLESLLDGKSEKEVMDIFVNFKKKIIDMNPWVLARPCGANAVSFYTNEYNEFNAGRTRQKPRIPGAIAGAIYYNMLLDVHGEEHLPRIGDGSKVYNCKLKRNSSGFTSISFPTDLVHIPDWFKKLPFDTESIIDSVFIKKVENIFGVVGFNINMLNASTKFFDNFEEDEF